MYTEGMHDNKLLLIDSLVNLPLIPGAPAENLGGSTESHVFLPYNLISTELMDSTKTLFPNKVIFTDSRWAWILEDIMQCRTVTVTPFILFQPQFLHPYLKGFPGRWSEKTHDKGFALASAVCGCWLPLLLARPHQHYCCWTRITYVLMCSKPKPWDTEVWVKEKMYMQSIPAKRGENKPQIHLPEGTGRGASWDKEWKSMRSQQRPGDQRSMGKGIEKRCSNLFCTDVTSYRAHHVHKISDWALAHAQLKGHGPLQS